MPWGARWLAAVNAALIPANLIIPGSTTGSPRGLDGQSEVCRHRRIPECERKHSPLPGERTTKTKRAPARKASAEEVHLRSLGPEVAGYLDALHSRPVRYSYARLRRLYRLACEYPREIFVPTIAHALARRAFDLNQLERVLEEKMGHRIRTASLGEGSLEERPAYRQGQVTPHQLRSEPAASKTAEESVDDDENEPEPPPETGGPS